MLLIILMETKKHIKVNRHFAIEWMLEKLLSDGVACVR